jgi:SpoVK/Ycf46/Vps4 family AAA+-type ATPase
MEEYEGIAILTTNLRNNMDKAFIRRLRFIIEFPMPTPEQRLQILQRALPQQTPAARILTSTP